MSTTGTASPFNLFTSIQNSIPMKYQALCSHESLAWFKDKIPGHPKISWLTMLSYSFSLKYPTFCWLYPIFLLVTSIWIPWNNHIFCWLYSAISPLNPIKSPLNHHFLLGISHISIDSPMDFPTTRSRRLGKRHAALHHDVAWGLPAPCRVLHELHEPGNSAGGI